MIYIHCYLKISNAETAWVHTESTSSEKMTLKPVCTKRSYLADFRQAACAAAASPERAAALTKESARVCAMASHIKGLSLCHGISDRP